MRFPIAFIFNLAAIGVNGSFVADDPTRWWALVCIGFHVGLALSVLLLWMRENLA